MDGRLFITDPDQQDQFERDREKYARQIRSGNEKNAAPQSLVATIVGFAEDYEAERKHGFQCIGIAVDGGDGMTWSAHSVDRAIEDALPDVRRIRMKGEPGSAGRPELAEVIPMHRIAMAAQKNGLVKSVRLFSRRVTIVAVLAALVVGIAGALLSEVSSASVTSRSVTLRAVIFSIIAVILALAAQFFGQLVFPNLWSNAYDKVADDLRAQEKESVSDEYLDFVDQLAVLLAGFAGFRCVIVDDFGGLDQTTRMVLNSYLQHQADSKQDELWIIFYWAAEKSLEVLVNKPTRAEPYGYRYTRLFKQDHLSVMQRRELANAYRCPERAIFVTVRAIARDSSGLRYLEDLFTQEYKKRESLATGKRVGDTLDFFYLIAINASSGGNPWLPERDIVANFSRERGLRSAVLRALMPGRTLSRAVLDAELGNVRNVFLPQAGEKEGDGSHRRLRSTAEAGEILETKWNNFGLADPRIVHLFWVLYWSDTELNGISGVFFLQEIVTHFLRSAVPADLDAYALGKNVSLNALAKELFEVAHRCLQACLRYCLLTDVPQLLERARTLTEDGDKEERRRRRRRLRRLAWQAYGLLGDERVLSVALGLEPSAEQIRPVAGGKPAAGDELDLKELFLQSMPNASDERRRSMRGELAETDVGRSVASYAQIRACWLAASAQPFLGPGAPMLSRAVTQSHDTLPQMLDNSINALESAVEDEWRTTDILDIALGVWTLAVSTCRDWKLPDPESAQARHTALAGTLFACYVLADDLVKQRRSAGTDPVNLDLVADCLAEDLLTVIFAAGLLFLVRWPEFDGSRAAGWHDVAEIVRESGHSLGIRVPIRLADEGSNVDHEVITDATRCMGILAVLWRSLGFRQQASFMTIRQAQFAALAVPPTPEMAEQVIQMVSTDFDTVDHVGLLTHFAAAEGALFSGQLASQFLLRASGIARKANFGEQLVTEICFCTLFWAHSYGSGLGELLEYLIDRCADASGMRLDAALREVADDDFAPVVLILTNSLSAQFEPQQIDSVRSAIDRKMQHDVEDVEIVQQATGYLRMFEVARRQHAQQPVDINAELDAWADLRDLASYAGLLNLLIAGARGPEWDRVIAEAMRVLRARETYMTTTGYVLLAYNTLLQIRSRGHTLSPEDMQEATAALRAGVLSAGQFLQAQSNVEMLRLLSFYDSANSAEYKRRRLQWEQVVLELDETERLPRLIDQGQYFLLIWNYFEFFSYYGLRSEPSVKSWGLTESELSQELAKWRKNREVVPDPILYDKGAERLSGEFLALGYALFFPPAVDPKQRQLLEAELDDGRRQFDAKARSAVEAFYRMLRSLPQLPQTIEHILTRHQSLVLARMEGIDPARTGT